MPQDMPPTGGYQPVQYKVRALCEESRWNLVAAALAGLDARSVVEQRWPS